MAVDMRIPKRTGMRRQRIKASDESSQSGSSERKCSKKCNAPAFRIHAELDYMWTAGDHRRVDTREESQGHQYDGLLSTRIAGGMQFRWKRGSTPT